MGDNFQPNEIRGSYDAAGMRFGLERNCCYRLDQSNSLGRVYMSWLSDVDFRILRFLQKRRQPRPLEIRAILN